MALKLTTTKKQLREALIDGDKPEDLICFYQNNEGIDRRDKAPIIRCRFDELPEREFDPGYGGPNGEPCIAFSDRYVYVKGMYDGCEWFEAIPRHPDQVTWIPWVGGGS